MDKYISIQESMLKLQLEQLGAEIHKMKGSMCYVLLTIGGIKFKYLYHINRKNKYCLQRISPYNIPIATFDTEEEIIDTIKTDINKFNNANNSKKFQDFIETNRSLLDISKSFEDAYLHYNISKYDLKDINDEILNIKNKLNHIINNSQIVYPKEGKE